jgi:predicted Zn-dependent protease
MPLPVPTGAATGPTAGPDGARRWPARLGAALWGHLRRRRRAWAAAALLALAAAGLAPAVPQARAWYHLRAARLELRRYHNRQAVLHLQACLRAWPADPEVLLLAARSARRAGAYDEARALLDKAQRVRGLDDALVLERTLLAAERDCDEAVVTRCWRDVEQGHPEAPLLLEALARGYLRQFRLREARMCLDRWLEAQPDNPQALCLDGQFHLDYERALSAAVESYRRAVAADPEHEEARIGLAIALLQSKSYEEAAGHLDYLWQRQPDNLRVAAGLAECRLALGDREAAERLVARLLAERPDYAPALAVRGRLELEAGQYAEAEATLRRAVAADPADNHSRYSLILCLHHSGQEAEARDHKAQLARREANLKRFNEIVTQELGRRPNDPVLPYELGRLLLESGIRDEGLRWLHNALRLDPRYEPARKLLAEQFQKGGQRPRE